MEDRGWLTALIVPAIALDTGRPVNLITGVIATDGGLQIALRIGEYGEAVILPPSAASQLVVNLREAIATKTGESQ